MSKRPTGFGKATKQKKLKVEPEVHEAELDIELSGDIEDQELAEVYGLYAKLREERDPKLARGLIHESNQLLKSRDEQMKTLPDKFHVAYGGALLTLADPQFQEDHKAFRDAGVERINIGLTSADSEAVAVAVTELIQYAHTQISDKTLEGAGRKIFKHALGLLKKRVDQENIELAKAALSLLHLLDEMGFEDDAAKVAHDVLHTQANSHDQDIQRWGNKGLGHYYLYLALDPAARAEGLLKKAVEYFTKALSDNDPDSYVTLAETLLELGGLMESDTDLDDEGPTNLYDDALKHLKKARLLGKPGLNDVIEALENPDEE